MFSMSHFHERRVFINPPWIEWLFDDTRSAPLWFIIRIYLGWAWLTAGWHKIMSPAWVGPNAGAAVEGFTRNALTKVTGPHPDVSGWYAWFLENIVLHNLSAWSHAIAWGEVLVGLGLIVGAFTGIAAFFGLLMNFNFLLAGTVSTNPILFALGLLVLMGWKVAGYIGLDYFILCLIGTPWRGDDPGIIFKTCPGPGGIMNKRIR